MSKKPSSIDEYISEFSGDVLDRLKTIRKIIKEAAPEAEETIKYAIPTFTMNGNLVHFAAFRNHIGFYPTPSGTEKFQKELSRYKAGKGSVRFPLNEPLPIELISRIVKYRVKETKTKE